MKKMELLAPAGTMEKMKMALLYGADAVYLAGKVFGLRAYGGNFSMEELKEAVSYAHSMGKKVYVTVNIIPRNEDLEGLDDYLKYLESIHVDAVLISDLGVFSLCREVAPHLPIHVSTQASSANWRTVKMWKDLGAERVVLAREVSVKEMADIRRKVDIDLEVFGHGAMCISWSGRCLLSNFFTNGKRQSNRGECIQACRFRYAVMEESRPGQYWPVEEDEHGTYIFNSKDLCMIDHLRELLDAGVDSLKIEGRAKTFYYVASVTAAYRRALDAYLADPLNDNFELPAEVYEELTRTSHRHYSPGFYFGREQARQATDSATYIREWEFVGTVEGWENGVASCQQRGKWSLGDTLEALCPDGRSIALTPEWIENEAGERVESTPHAMEKYTMPTPELPPMSLLRRKTV